MISDSKKLAQSERRRGLSIGLLPSLETSPTPTERIQSMSLNVKATLMKKKFD